MRCPRVWSKREHKMYHDLYSIEWKDRETILGVKVFVRENQAEFISADNAVIMACTGFTDRNGKLIYEDDLLTQPVPHLSKDIWRVVPDLETGGWRVEGPQPYKNISYKMRNWEAIKSEVVDNIWERRLAKTGWIGPAESTPPEIT